MIPTNPTARRGLAALAVVALALGVAACSGDDDGDAAGQTQPAGGDIGDGGGQQGGESTFQPEGRDDLGIEVRNPRGLRMAVSSIAFEGDNILVGLEFHNGTPEDVSVHDTTWDYTVLRLVDDAGNAYNFLPPEEDDEAQVDLSTIPVGDSVSGTLTFLGPLEGETEQLRVVTNVEASTIEDFTFDGLVDESGWPALVASIDLS
jgi:hypothetical protein